LVLSATGTNGTLTKFIEAAPRSRGVLWSGWRRWLGDIFIDRQVSEEKVSAGGREADAGRLWKHTGTNPLNRD